MGQFSWLDCKTGEQVIDGKRRKSYVLVPEQFGGGHIEEDCYEGYGEFGGHDVYDLVAIWNKEEIGEPEMPSRDGWYDDENGDEWYLMAVKRWLKLRRSIIDFKNGIDSDCMREKYGENWLRTIGIGIACYDKDNAALRYPIKITHDKNAVYEWCPPSPSDPNQGWVYED